MSWLRRERLSMEKAIVRQNVNRSGFVVFISSLFFTILFLFNHSALSTNSRTKFTLLVNNFANTINVAQNPSGTVRREPEGNSTIKVTHFVNERENSCSGRYIYMYELPSRFNKDLLMNCETLLKWTDMCKYISNMGLGPRVKNFTRVLSNKGWFETNQFSLEIIFHYRMKRYQCLTNDSSLASAIYVPFYAGLDVARFLWGFNTTVRDSLSMDLVKWVSQRNEWKRSLWGLDHFFVGGRISWDFRRPTDNDSDWGSKLMVLPESKNITLLSIESGSWNNDISIPYPTYFHPSKDSQVFDWQKKMKRQKRPFLFSFAGAPRPHQPNSIRSELIRQCQSSESCYFLGCYEGGNCDNPVIVMKPFQSSVFCLQPPGDSYTRRSTFDSILAGCIPVFFHPDSAYTQYLWHFPKNYTKYSVFVPTEEVKDGKVIINETLSRISKDEVLAMRNEVISLIPRILYADPRSKLETLEDAFDIAVEGILERVESIRMAMKNGKDPSIEFF